MVPSWTSYSLLLLLPFRFIKIPLSFFSMHSTNLQMWITFWHRCFFCVHCASVLYNLELKIIYTLYTDIYSFFFKIVSLSKQAVHSIYFILFLSQCILQTRFRSVPCSHHRKSNRYPAVCWYVPSSWLHHHGQEVSCCAFPPHFLSLCLQRFSSGVQSNKHALVFFCPPLGRSVGVVPVLLDAFN